MTLTGHVLVWIGIWSALSGQVELAIAVLMIAMLLDAIDGKVARSLGIARPFGRYLGSFVDLVNYTVCPPLILHAMGFRSWPAVLLLFAFSTCGLLRLSRFNEVGNIEDETGSLAYLGLPVFWIHFALMGLYGVRALGGLGAFQLATALVLPPMAVCFILDRPFWKPQNYTLIALVTLAGSFGFFWLAFRESL